MHANTNINHSQVNSYQHKNSSKVYSIEEKIRWNKIKAPHYAWAECVSLKHKCSLNEKHFLKTIVRCSNSKGVSNIGVQAQTYQFNLTTNGKQVKQRTIERYIAKFRKLKVIKKYDSRKFRKSHATRLVFKATDKVSVLIYSPKSIVRRGGVVSSINSTLNAPPPLVAVGAEEPEQSKEEQIRESKEKIKKMRQYFRKNNIGASSGTS